MADHAVRPADASSLQDSVTFLMNGPNIEALAFRVVRLQFYTHGPGSRPKHLTQNVGAQIPTSCPSLPSQFQINEPLQIHELPHYSPTRLYQGVGHHPTVSLMM